MDDNERQRNPELDEVERDQQAERGPDAEIEPADTAQQDFGARNVIMSNALQGGASPAAGGVIGSGGELGMEPTTDEERADDSDDLPSHEKRQPPNRR